MTTYLAEIHAIADQLQAEGTEPSVRAVAKVLGIHNTGLIGAGLNEWKARKAALVEAADMPNAFREELDLFGIALLRAAKAEGELQARVMGDEIRRLHKAASVREAELLAQAAARENEMKAEMDERARSWEEQRADLVAKCKAKEDREQALTEKIAYLEAEWEKAEEKVQIAEVARTKAEASRDAADALLADLTQANRSEIGKIEAEKVEWQERAIHAERKVSVYEQLLNDAKERERRGAERINGLVSDIVMIAGNKMPAERRSDPPPSQAYAATSGHADDLGGAEGVEAVHEGYADGHCCRKAA